MWAFISTTLRFLRFSFSAFNCAIFVGSLTILTCGKISCQDICRLRRQRHIRVIGLGVPNFFSM